MSKFGSTADIIWTENNSAGTPLASHSINLTEEDMPQWPVEEDRVTDEVQYRAKSGKIWNYRNYNKRTYAFNWSNLRESKHDELGTFARAAPIFLFLSGGNSWGLLRLVPGSVQDSEVSYGLYDMSFEVEEA
jgi:hypothetical protein